MCHVCVLLSRGLFLCFPVTKALEAKPNTKEVMELLLPTFFCGMLTVIELRQGQKQAYSGRGGLSEGSPLEGQEESDDLLEILKNLWTF